MSKSLGRMTESLGPFGYYSLDPESFVSRELSAYAYFLDQVDAALDALLREGFVETATEEGLSRWEALTGARQREGASLEKRREMLLARLRRRPDDFSPGDMEEALRGLGIHATLIEHLPQEQIVLSDETAIGDLEEYLRIRQGARDLLPAHLELLFAMGRFTWQIFHSKNFTWSQWNGLQMNWMAYEIYQ